MSGILDHTCTSKRARLTKKAQTLANKSEAAVFQMLLFPLSQWADKQLRKTPLFVCCCFVPRGKELDTAELSFQIRPTTGCQVKQGTECYRLLDFSN